MTRVRQSLIGLVIVAGASVGSFFAAQWYCGPRNFHVVEDGVLYRSGQLTPEELTSVLDQYHIKTVITLRTVREANKPYPDEWERVTLRGTRRETRPDPSPVPGRPMRMATCRPRSVSASSWRSWTTRPTIQS